MKSCKVILALTCSKSALSLAYEDFMCVQYFRSGYVFSTEMSFWVPWVRGLKEDDEMRRNTAYRKSEPSHVHICLQLDNAFVFELLYA